MNKIPSSNPVQGPAEMFTGEVTIETIKPVSENSRLSISSVHFEPGARAAWHSHPHGQTLIVTEGVGVIQRKGEPIQLIKKGEVVWTEPNEEHWHGGSANSSMTHLAIQELDDQGNLATWGKHVTDEEYIQQPKP